MNGLDKKTLTLVVAVLMCLSTDALCGAAADVAVSAQPAVNPAAAAEPVGPTETEDSEDTPSIPVPPPPLMTTALGDTIHMYGGRRPIQGVIVIKKTVLDVKYEAFFDHPNNARRYVHTASIIDVQRIEKSGDDDHKRLRAAWDRKLQQVAAYNDQIKKSGYVMFRGEYVAPDRVAEIKLRERENQIQADQAKAARLQAARRRTLERSTAAEQERRRQMASSLQPGQNAAMLNMLGQPSSRREAPLVTGALQTEVTWEDLGLRVIVQNGYIAFIERFAQPTVQETPTRETPGRSPTTPLPRQ
jgi:hypothetical protein